MRFLLVYAVCFIAGLLGFSLWKYSCSGDRRTRLFLGTKRADFGAIPFTAIFFTSAFLLYPDKKLILSLFFFSAFLSWQVYTADRRRKFNLKMNIYITVFSAVLYYMGVRVNFISSFSGGVSYLRLLSLPATILWILAVSNLLEKVNKIESFVTILIYTSSLLIFIQSYMLDKEQLLYPSLLALAFAGTAQALLVFSFPPVRLLSGKGSGFLFGFILSALSIINLSKTTLVMSFFLPLTILIVPVLLVTFIIFYIYFMGGSFMNLSGFSLSWKMDLKETLIFITFFSVIFSAIVLSFKVINILAGFLLLLNATVLLVVFASAFFLEKKKKASITEAPSIELMGTGIDNATMDEMVERLEKHIDEKKDPAIVVTINSLMIQNTYTDPEFRDILNGSSYRIPDGIGVIWAAEFLGFPLKERVPGIDLLKNLCRLSARKGYRIFLLGASGSSVTKAGENLKSFFPALDICGIYPGFFKPALSAEVIARIKEARPQILFVGLGSPKQEKWISANLQELNIPLSIGVGGSFDVIAGKLKRAPSVFQRTGFEWLYRIVQEPYRIIRILSLPVFIFDVFIEKILVNSSRPDRP